MVAPPSNSNSPQPGKKDRRDAARETARIEREAEKKRQRRNRVFLQGGIVVGVIAIIAVVALVIVNVNANKPTGDGPKNMASDGILLSGSTMAAVPTPAIKAGGKPVPTDPSSLKGVRIVTYIDYQCPFCQQFEAANSQQIESMVTSGAATLEIHPIAFLDDNSLGNKYASRAANAAACVANYDPNKFYAVNTALFANQPAENTSGKSDKELIAVLKDAGSSSGKISSCITSQAFVPWVTAATARIDPSGKTVTFKGVANTPQKFAGTPTVFVNGERFTGSITDPAVFAAFVEAAASAG
jgi:protein-disulfide isomerase